MDCSSSFPLPHLNASHLPHPLTSLTSQVDNYKEKELTELFRKYEVKAPVTGNPVTDPVYFNLMFATSIGPGGQISGYV